MSQTAIVAVLAGGQGRRLGGEKASRSLGGRALISYPLAAARAAGLEALVIAKRATVLPQIDEQVVFEPDHPQHPLCGVLTALQHAAARRPSAAIVLTACDMPFLTGPLLAWLAGLEEAVMTQGTARPQPLLGRCLPEQRAPLEEALAAESSLIAAMSSLQPRIVSAQELSRFGDPERLSFNVNEPADLELAEQWLA